MWLLECPDRAVAAIEAHNEVLHSHYNFLGMGDTTFPISTVHKHLARQLPPLLPGIQEEVHHAVDTVFGRDTESWKTLNLWDAWIGLVPQITNRILVGKQVCRDPEFLRCQVAFADDVVRNGFFLTMVPKILHPIFGRLVTLPNWWHWKKATDVLRPVIERQLRDMALKRGGELCV